MNYQSRFCPIQISEREIRLLISSKADKIFSETNRRSEVHTRINNMQCSERYYPIAFAKGENLRSDLARIEKIGLVPLNSHLQDKIVAVCVLLRAREGYVWNSRAPVTAQMKRMFSLI